MRLLSATARSLAFVAAAGLFVPTGAMAAKKDDEKKAADEKAGPKLAASPKFVKGAKAVQDLIAAKDYDTALSKMPEAEALASTPDDHYFIGSFYLNIGIGKQDTAMQRKGLDAMLESGKVAPDLIGRYQVEAGKLAQINKDVAAARDHYNKAIAAGNATTPSDPYLMLAETYFGEASDNVEGSQLNAKGKAIALQGLPYLKKAIELEGAGGKPVPAAWYKRGMTMAVLSGAPDQFDWVKQTVVSAPNPENWRLALRTLQDGNSNMTRDEDLDILRLMAATKALGGDYSTSEYAEIAWRLGLPGEVLNLVDTESASGAVKKDRYTDLYKLASTAAPKDKASLPAGAADAAKAATGKTAANTASAYLGYGDYAKSAELYRLALQKGGVDANEVNTRLGIALARAGDNAGAHAAFAAVTGTGLRKQIADMWSIWLDQNKPA